MIVKKYGEWFIVINYDGFLRIATQKRPREEITMKTKNIIHKKNIKIGVLKLLIGRKTKQIHKTIEDRERLKFELFSTEVKNDCQNTKL